MTLIITVLHILVSFTLIFVVLLQKGSGADMGAAFGGSSQSVFGARGSGSFLGKMTAGLATVFMLTSLSLAFFTTHKGANISVMEQGPITQKKQPEPIQQTLPASGPPVPAKGGVQPPPVTSAPSEVPTPPGAPAHPAAPTDATSPAAPMQSMVPPPPATPTPTEAPEPVGIQPIPALPAVEQGQENAIPSVPKSHP